MRAGRKRKAGVTRSNGRIIAAERQPTDDVTATARAQRFRDGAKPDNWRDHRRGSVLGRLLLKGCITEEQFEAGERWHGIVHRFARAWNIPMHTPRAVDLNAIRGGSGPDMDPEDAKRIRRAYEDGYAALHEAGRPALISVTECVIRDEVPLLISLRLGLNALVGHFGIATIQKAC